MLGIFRVACDQVWYEQIPFYNSNFSIPNGSASPFGKVFLEEISSKMTSIRGYRRPHWKRLSVTPSVTPSVAPPDSFPPLKLGDKLSDQPVRPLGRKPTVANIFATTISVPKNSEDDLQQIFKAVLEAQAPIPVPAPTSDSAPAPVVSKVSREKLKACSPDIYRRKSHMDYYNFCRQYEDYFATVGVIKLTQISFVVSFL